ncbi:hypothetical protein PYW08_010970 [Mythimna loreyi]|uniref:Uncharacterized protein n=1 Tax=Mythimna loreyi TaxID=667449 RepID=A0ACC2Q275_9NEOP|nr:hypothetical protein PYW08_010970 [Mythimna loreyi]
MLKLRVPTKIDNAIAVQNKWLDLLRKAQHIIEIDEAQQQAAAGGMRLKSRSLPPEVVGRNYASYCELVNQMYDAYLNNVQLQRAPYILDIIAVIMKRLYELRNELVHIIVNDYIYVDSALKQLQITPLDIQIVVPYHWPMESRSETVENVLQQLWVDALKRKRRRERPVKAKPPPLVKSESEAVSSEAVAEEEKEEEDSVSPPPSVHTFIPEEYIQSLVIQRHERYRQWHMADVREKALKRKQYFLQSVEPAPIEIRIKAALLIHLVYREFMKIKRQKILNYKRDILLGIAVDPFRKGPSFFEENNKVYEKRRNMRLEMKKYYLEELEQKKTRFIFLRKDKIIDDITDEVRTWIRQWYLGYHLFPQFPFDIEGGTLAVVRGDYPTITEQQEADEEMINATKGKTKEQIMAEKKLAKKEALAKIEADKIAARKEHEALVKSRCDPFSDPGYEIKMSENMRSLIEALQKYRATWSIYDNLPPENFGETIYGYMKPFLVEDIMKEMYFECRKFVDTLMRIDLKMLIKLHQIGYEEKGWTYPKVKARKKPKAPPKVKVVALDDKFFKNSECVFDLGIVTKPTVKFSDIYGDSSYAAYDFNIKDPDASFPPAGYGDIKNRLMLSCVLGCGIQPGAPRRKAVMLLGQERNGKTFLAETVAGELNAVKIDISPEVFTAVSERPQKALTQVFAIAKAFQPAVIFMKNIERVFVKKVPADQRHLNATILRGILGKMVKTSIQNEDKVIFIATCSSPWVAKTKPMLNMFDEILLVPRTDYASLQQFFYKKFQSIRSMPRDYPVQPLAQLCQGFGFAEIIDVFDEVMTPERIVRLNVKELSPAEIIQKFVDRHSEPFTVADYQKLYIDFFIENSELKQDKIDYARINFVRADVYQKAEKRERQKSRKTTKPLNE